MRYKVRKRDRQHVFPRFTKPFAALIALIIVLTILVTHPLVYTPESRCDLNWDINPFEDVGSGCFQPRYMADVDVVSIAVKPTCVTQGAIRGLNRFLGPRRIIIISPTSSRCAKFETMALNVKCLVEDSVIPGLSKNSVAGHMKEVYGVDGDKITSGRRLAGWYLQQFLKMGVAQYLDGLSQQYLLWDLDMIPLQPLNFFVNQTERKAVFNIGGYVTRTYEKSYLRLMGKPMEYAADGSSFVTHSMLVDRRRMVELLLLIAKDSEGGVARKLPSGIADSSLKAAGPESSAWIHRILETLDDQGIEKGFSEYGTYASWMKQNYPESMHILPTRTWARHPVGGTIGVMLQRLSHYQGLCCPATWMVSLMRLLGYKFMGFEIGHHMCHYTDSRYEEEYGL